MSLRYNSFKYSYPAGILITGASPVDNRLVVMNIDQLTALETWKESPAYQGLIVSVLESKEAYMFAPDSSTDWDATKPENWKKISSPDLDISGRMVTVIEYQSGKWAKEDGSGEGDQWQPNPGAQPLPQSENLVVGESYLQLALNDDDYVYINSKELISLDDYYTKEQVDEKISILDSSISDALDDIRNYVDETTEAIDSSIDRIDASVLELFNNVDELADELAEVTDIVGVLGDDVDDISTRVDELENNTVKSISSLNAYVTVDPEVGHVSIDVSTIDAKDDTKFPSYGFVTDGYVEERLDVFNWVEVENK